MSNESSQPSSHDPPTPVRNESPATKLVFKCLVHEGESHLDEIVAWTYLPKRTVRMGLNRLRDHGIVERKRELSGDARRTKYHLSDDVTGE